MTHVFVSHHHLDHVVNIALFRQAELVDFRTVRRDDHVEQHSGEGFRLAPNTTIWVTPGHSPEDASLVVDTAEGRHAFTASLVADRPHARGRPVLARSCCAGTEPTPAARRCGRGDPRPRSPLPGQVSLARPPARPAAAAARRPAGLAPDVRGGLLHLRVVRPRLGEEHSVNLRRTSVYPPAPVIGAVATCGNRGCGFEAAA